MTVSNIHKNNINAYNNYNNLNNHPNNELESDYNESYEDNNNNVDNYQNNQDNNTQNRIIKADNVTLGDCFNKISKRINDLNLFAEYADNLKKENDRDRSGVKENDVFSKKENSTARSKNDNMKLNDDAKKYLKNKLK